MMDRGKMGGETRGWSAHRVSREPFPSLSVATRARHTGDVDGPHVVVVPLVRPDLAAKAVGDYGPPPLPRFQTLIFCVWDFSAGFRGETGGGIAWAKGSSFRRWADSDA